MFRLSAEILLAAFVTDLLVGDPRWLTHPTQMMGWVISRLETLLRRAAHNPGAEKVVGSLLVTVVVAGSYGVTFYLLAVVADLSPVAGTVLQVWLLASTIATRELARAGGAVYRYLTAQSLELARQAMGRIVGRDTATLTEPEVVRGTVETVAENTVDGVIAPLCFAVIGGVPLAMAYRAVNTLDAMLGYRDERYRYFGWAAARLDDVANYLPARITGVLMLAVITLSRLDSRSAWRAWQRDASKHPSPNSGIPESVVAGAMGVRLGGTNYYRGQASFRAYMGEDKLPLASGHIRQVVRMMYGTAVLGVACGVALLLAGGWR